MTETSKLTDEQIVIQVRKTDKELFREIIKRYQNQLMRYVTYLTQDYNKAAEIVQETFIKAFINLNGFDIKKKFSSWLFRIAHNETMNMFTRNKYQMSLNQQFDLEHGIGLEDEMIKKELKTHTEDCLKQLPLIYREPLTLFFLEDKSYEEISDILRIAIGTVGARINRAKLLMKKICTQKNQQLTVRTPPSR